MSITNITPDQASAGAPGAASSPGSSNETAAPRKSVVAPGLRAIADVQRPRLTERTTTPGTEARPPVTTQFQNIASRIAELFGRSAGQAPGARVEAGSEDHRPLLLVTVAAIQELSGAMHAREAEIAALRDELRNTRRRVARLETWLTS